MTLGEALRAAVGDFERHRIPSPRLTAEVLLAHCLNVDRPHLYAHDQDSLDPSREQEFRVATGRRTNGEPLQYITGRQEFYGRVFGVDPSVLIPRPETEFVVDAVKELNRRSHPGVVDVGTGSGCIAITLALDIENSTVTATDISFDALQTARANAVELAAEVSFVTMDQLYGLNESFDFVVSNPPYVSENEYAGLQREVRDNEPRIALVPDQGPQRFYEQLVEDAARCLVTDGFMVLEIGYSMEEAIRKLFGEGWELLPTRRDLQGIPRVIIARKM
jgi:release factor glutamine methyltransferase